MLPPGVIGQWRGPNLLIDGDAEDVGVGAWTVGNAVASKGTTDPIQGQQTLTVTKSSPGPSYVRQAVLTPGSIYRLTGWTRCDGAGDLRIYDNGYELWFCDETEWTPFDIHFLARASYIYFYAIAGGADDYFDLDDLYLSVEPDLAPNLLADGSMEDPYPGWRILSADGYCTKITTDPYEGDRALRLTRETVHGQMTRAALSVSTDYRLTGVARSGGVCTPRILYAPDVWIGTTSTEWQDIDISFTATTNALVFYSFGGGSGDYTDWDDLVLLEV